MKHETFRNIVLIAIIGAALGFLLAGGFRGLLGGAAGILPAILSLGASNRDNNRVAESIGRGREEAQRSAELAERSEDLIRSATTDLRRATEELRKSAKPIGNPTRSSDRRGTTPDWD